MKFASLPKLAAAAVLATAVIAGAGLPVSTAHAKKIIIVKGGHHHHFRHRFHGGLYLAAAPVVVGGGCYWLKMRALNTGSPYWWSRYTDCRGY